MTIPPALQHLGVRVGKAGGELRVYSSAADGIDLVMYDTEKLDHIAERVSLSKGKGDVWSASSALLVPGAEYTLQAWGPTTTHNSFNAEALLIDPYAKGLVHRGTQWRATVVDESFDWEGVAKPKVALDHTIIYEAHVRGLTKMHPGIPLELRGTYAGLGHEAMTTYLNELGVTAVELLPVHQFLSEQFLLEQGMVNYWGYNTLNFFTPQGSYATKAARAEGSSAILREFKQMVKNLHAAGIEVILDVVYNHTAEEGPDGPRLSLRGLDNGAYYRQDVDGNYVDTTGCGNSVNTAHPAAAQLILDSLRYWAEECQVDGFRFDLAAELGRDENHEFQQDHPLFRAMQADPIIGSTKLIAEPWDVGMGGWQTGDFAPGWREWNDRYRDRIRNFWLPDIAEARETGMAPTGVGGFATRLAGSSNTFSEERGPVASVNFITAHDGFTLADLTTFNYKHNIGNGEDNRDGSGENRSFNHGIEGPTDDSAISNARRRSMRNLMGTLMLSAGIPMITAGDEHGRTQHGNNNAYCHDSPLTWVNWELQPWQRDLLTTTTYLAKLRREHPALRPVRFGRFGETIPSASQMDWYNAQGRTMTQEEWQDPHNRTLQFVAASTPENEDFNRILMIVHGIEQTTDVVVPEHPGVKYYAPLWFSPHPAPREIPGVLRPGETFKLNGTSILLYNAE